jgi:hypothetical protein
MEDSLEDLLQEAFAALQKRRTRRDNPYVVDLIGVLRPHGEYGLSRRRVIDTLERVRRAKGLPVPPTFDEVVQSAFNQHCVDSVVFKVRRVPADGLFSSRRDGPNATWIVHVGRADAWLLARKQINASSCTIA